MNDPSHAPLRSVKTLAERAADLEAQEEQLIARIREDQQSLRALTIQRCAIAYEQSRGIGSTLKKKLATGVSWEQLLQREDSERRTIKKARIKALADLHLKRAWLPWVDFPQIVLAVELPRKDPTEMFWVRDGLREVLPHVKCAVPGYKVFGISHDGVYSIRYFLMCAESSKHFQVVEAYLPGGDKLILEADSLQGILELIQRHLPRD